MTAKRPNILLIITDTQRTDSIAAYGNQRACSPNLDRLASHGVLFTECRSPSPVCGPARSCLLTGQYPPTNGALENGVERRSDVPTLFAAVRGAGYHTVYVGKTHFGEVPVFDESHLLHGEKNQDRNDCYADFIRARGYSRASAHPNPVPAEDFVDAFCVSQTIESLDRAPADRPWFACCSLLSPHGPIDPPQPWDDRFVGATLPDDDDPQPRLAEEAGPIRELLGYQGEREPAGESTRRARELYYGLCAYVDDQVGRLVAWLAASCQRDNTLVIFTSDHGVEHYADGYGDKHTFRPNCWRVPLIVSQPGMVPQGERRAFASWVDVTTGILAAAGCDAAWSQGFDIFGALRDGTPNPRTACLGTLLESMALCTSSWTYEWHPATDEERLFDRTADPHELQDLSGSPTHADLRARLFRALATWRALLVDHDCLQKRLSGGGPVARRVVAQCQARIANHADMRLCEMVAG